MMTRARRAMDGILHAMVNGTFALIRGPLLLLLMASIVVSVARHPPGPLAPTHRLPPTH
jgi:hypothetical protein